jgi:hypothetical protein
MRKIMIRRSFLVFYIIMFISTTGCIKETYDMNMLSKRAHLSPTWAVSAIKGDILFTDLVKSNDTVRFGENTLVKVVFRKDSILNFEMSDFYDLNNMVSFHQIYPIGVLSIDPFQGTVTHTLDQISIKLGAPYRATFLSINGTNANFPTFPSVNMSEVTLPVFPNFDNALFFSGMIDVTIKNNLTGPISGATIKLYNNTGHIQIGANVNVSTIQAGDSVVAPIDLAGLSISNSMNVSVVIAGSPGTSTPVPINLSTNNVKVRIKGRDLKVLSGRVILPNQTITTLDNKDTVTFNPGTNVEIDKFMITTGDISYSIISSSPATAAITIALPTAMKPGNIPVSKIITINPNTTEAGTISVNNSLVDMGTDVSQPYNRVPMEYSILIGSNNTKIDFSWADEYQIDMELVSPDFDYVKGYFGQQTEEIKLDTFKLEVEKIMEKITGDFLISSPSMKLIYSNSFAIPIEITLDAKGYYKTEIVDLARSPFTLSYPSAPVERDKIDSSLIDKSNSNLPALISMPPDQIRYGGSAIMNPSGNDGSRNNYMFSNSRFDSELEIEVPMEFRFNNLQFEDTSKNFLADVFEAGSDLNWDDFELFRIDFDVKNGFPMGVSLTMSLLDSIDDNHILSTIDATDLIEPAPVDGNGKASGVTISSTSIPFTKEFFSSIKSSKKIVFTFTLNTTDNGSKDVKIYSDYKINFKAALVLKPDVNLNLK